MDISSSPFSPFPFNSSFLSGGEREGGGRERKLYPPLLPPSLLKAGGRGGASLPPFSGTLGNPPLIFSRFSPFLIGMKTHKPRDSLLFLFSAVFPGPALGQKVAIRRGHPFFFFSPSMAGGSRVMMRASPLHIFSARFCTAGKEDGDSSFSLFFPFFPFGPFPPFLPFCLKYCSKVVFVHGVH